MTGMPEFDTSVPHIARVYDYWLGGKDNVAADRALGEQTIAAYPKLVYSVRANRAFLARAVRFLARECGIRQFLDIGTGIPTANNTHEVAQHEAPESRIVYVELSHAASDIDAEQVAEMVKRINQSGAEKTTLRDRAGVTRLFDGLDLVEPGVIRAAEWRPDSEIEARSPAALWAGVARRP